MRKAKSGPFAALTAALAIAAMVGVGASSAQPRTSDAHTPEIHQQPDFISGPPRAFVPGPPSARSVRSGWATDTARLIRAPIKAIQCGQLLDVMEQRVRQNVTILINGERIVAIRDGLLRPNGADAIIDLHDQVCAPGLMDMHLHLTQEFLRPGETDRPRDPFYFNVSETAIALAFARDTLLSGVTTIRTPAEMLPNRAFAYLNESIQSGHHLGPRIFAASYQIGRDYAKATVIAAGEGYYERRVPSPVNVPYDRTRPGGDVRQAVRDSIARGEQWVKLSVDVGGELSFGMPHVRLWSLEEMRAMADEAHKWGARITGHIESDETTRDAALAGFDSVEHGYIPSRETANLMRERNVYWSTTLVDLTLGFDAGDPLLGAEQPTSRGRDTSALLRRRDEAFRYAYGIGVPIVWASDGAFEPGTRRGRMVLEFSQRLALGVTPWDLLKMATLNGAAMLGEANNLGSVDPGKYADIIAFPTNPLDDVRTYNRVSFVMKGGNIVRDDLHRSPLPDVFALRSPDVTYVVRDPRAPFTVGNLRCAGRDC